MINTLPIEEFKNVKEFLQSTLSISISQYQQDWLEIFRSNRLSSEVYIDTHIETLNQLIFNQNLHNRYTIHIYHIQDTGLFLLEVITNE